MVPYSSDLAPFLNRAVETAATQTKPAYRACAARSAPRRFQNP